MPLQVQQRRECEHHEKHHVVERENAQRAADDEVAEVVLLGTSVEQNAGNEKSGEHEEEVDAGPADGADVHDAKKDRGVRVAGERVVAQEDEQKCNAAIAVETGDVTARWPHSIHR